MEFLFQPFINFYNNITSGEPVVYIILLVVAVSVIVVSVIAGYKLGVSQIIAEKYWRNKK